MLPFTLLLGAIGVYWLLGILGAVDHDHSLGMDLDGAHGSHGAHGDSGVDVANSLHDPAHPLLGLMHGALRILNAHGVPLMMVISVLVSYLWGCSMLGNLWFNKGLELGPGTLVSIGALIAALVLTRITVTPLKPLFRLIQDDCEKVKPVVGRSGVVRTAVVNEREGQVEVENAGAPLLLNARIAEGTEVLKRGDSVIIIRYDETTGLYVVRSLTETS